MLQAALRENIWNDALTFQMDQDHWQPSMDTGAKKGLDRVASTEFLCKKNTLCEVLS